MAQPVAILAENLTKIYVKRRSLREVVLHPVRRAERVTALSGRPTIKKLLPLPMFTSTVTFVAAIPCTAYPNVLTSICAK